MPILSLVRAVACCVLLVATGCATGPTIRVDMDPSVSLGSYKTFAFFDPVATDNSKYASLASTWLKRSTRAELERLGFVYNESEPDLLVNFFLKIVDKREIRTTSGYYGYRSYRYGTWSNYPYVDTYDYRDGTLSVDLVDAKRKQLVWQGVAEGEVRDSSLKDPGPALDKVVTQIFSNFPYEPQR